MKITKIWFNADHIFGRDEEGKEYSQSLLWYPKLRRRGKGVQPVAALVP